MVVFGALDLFAFYRSFPKLARMLENYSPNVYEVLLFLMIISLLVSGPLLIMGNRTGFAIYYFQFPLRLTFLTTLTFGFIFKVLAPRQAHWLTAW